MEYDKFKKLLRGRKIVVEKCADTRKNHDEPYKAHIVGNDLFVLHQLFTYFVANLCNNNSDLEEYDGTNGGYRLTVRIDPDLYGRTEDHWIKELNAELQLHLKDDAEPVEQIYTGNWTKHFVETGVFNVKAFSEEEAWDKINDSMEKLKGSKSREYVKDTIEITSVGTRP